MTHEDFVGNALCLDFANTVDKRPNPNRDRLGTGEDLVRWARAAGLPTTARPADRTTSALAAALDLREAVHRVFSAVASGGRPVPGDIAAIAAVYGEGIAEARLERQDDRFTLTWPRAATIEELRWPVAASAMRLLLHGPLHRVGACPSCGWLFLDTSSNGRRRWCSMAVCGGRAKARRHYAGKAGPDAGTGVTRQPT